VLRRTLRLRGFRGVEDESWQALVGWASWVMIRSFNRRRCLEVCVCVRVGW